MASNTLIKQALCRDPSDYESLLASLSIVRTLLDCDPNGNVVEGAATDILKKLFKGIEQFTADEGDCCNNDGFTDLEGAGAWTKFDENCVLVPGSSCFKNLCIYFNTKVCWPGVCPWRIICDPCIEEALEISICMTNMGCDELCFTDIAECFAKYLGCQILNPGTCSPDPTLQHDPNCPEIGEPLHDVLVVLDALCSIVKQKAEAKRILKKALLTITNCDF